MAIAYKHPHKLSKRVMAQLYNNITLMMPATFFAALRMYCSWQTIRVQHPAGLMVMTWHACMRIMAHLAEPIIAYQVQAMVSKTMLFKLNASLPSWRTCMQMSPMLAAIASKRVRKMGILHVLPAAVFQPQI